VTALAAVLDLIVAACVLYLVTTGLEAAAEWWWNRTPRPARRQAPAFRIVPPLYDWATDTDGPLPGEQAIGASGTQEEVPRG